MHRSRPLPAALRHSWLAVPLVAGAAALSVGSGQPLFWVQAGQAAITASAHHQTFNVDLELGDEVELARNGPLRYVARCVYDRSPGEDYNSDDDRYVPRQTDPVVRVGVFVTSTADGFTSSGRTVQGGRTADGTFEADSVDYTLPANEDRRVASTSATPRETSFTFDGGDSTYAESSGQTFYLGFDRVGLGANFDRRPPGCTVAGTAFTATGTPQQ